jgi:hypothetical protein
MDTVNVIITTIKSKKTTVKLQLEAETPAKIQNSREEVIFSYLQFYGLFEKH